MLEFLFALIVTILVMALLVLVLGWQHPVHGGKVVGLIFLFFVLLLAIWAAGVWIVPFGPAIGGVPWLPFFLVGLALLLIFLVLLPPSPRRHRTRAMHDTGMQDVPEKAAWAAFGVFFWIMAVFFILAIVVSYV